MNWLLFALASLAVFRLARLFSEEEGPASIFTNLRRQVPAKTNPGRGIRCPFCLSVWFGAMLTGYLVWLGEVTLPLAPVCVFALSGASVLLHLFSKA